MYVCMYGYAYRRAFRYQTESRHGVREWAHDVCEHIFEATPAKVKGHQAKLH